MHLWSSGAVQVLELKSNLLIFSFFRDIVLFMEVIFLHIFICLGDAALLGKSTCREIIHS